MLRITPTEGAAWDVAVGQAGWARTPNPAHIAVLSDYTGFVLDVVEHRVVVERVGTIRITEDERHDLVLLVRETDVTAVGHDGIRWSSDRLAWDDLKVVAIESDRIVLTGYLGDFTHDRVAIDPRDGRQLSGPRVADF